MEKENTSLLDELMISYKELSNEDKEKLHDWIVEKRLKETKQRVEQKLEETKEKTGELLNKASSVVGNKISSAGNKISNLFK